MDMSVDKSEHLVGSYLVIPGGGGGGGIYESLKYPLNASQNVKTNLKKKSSLKCLEIVSASFC